MIGQRLSPSPDSMPGSANFIAGLADSAVICTEKTVKALALAAVLLGFGAGRRKDNSGHAG
jgi:hypothetical protein